MSWESDHWKKDRSVFCFIAIVFSFIFAPDLVTNHTSYVLFKTIFFMIFLVMAYSVKRSPFIWYTEQVLAFLFFSFGIYALYYQSLTSLFIEHFLVVIFLSIILVDLIKNMISSRRINTNLIFGALIAYFFIGILWSKIYSLQNALHPGSFQTIYQSVNFHQLNFARSFEIEFNLMYYSFSVLTTLGFGDIIPMNTQAKAFSVLEAVAGQFFIGIIVAKLVAIWRYPISHHGN